MTAWVPQGEIGKDKTRHAAMFDNVTRRTDDHGRDAVRFKIVCNQTHGLVTNGSKRCDESGVGAVLPYAPQKLGRVVLHGFAMAVIRWYAVEPRRQLGKQSFSNQPSGRINRQEAFPVIGVRRFLILCEIGIERLGRRCNRTGPNFLLPAAITVGTVRWASRGQQCLTSAPMGQIDGIA